MSTCRRTNPGAVALLALVLALTAAVLIAAPAARADGGAFGVGSFTSTFSETQAGGHPDVSTSINLSKDGLGNSIGQMKNLELELPAGVVGNPQATPQCSPSDLRAAKCPLDSQVGIMEPLFVLVCPGIATTLGNEGITSAPPTEIAGLPGPNSSILTVASTAGISGGDILTVGEQGETVQFTVAWVIDATHLQLIYPIESTVTVGAPVRDDVIHVADTTHFCAGEENEIRIGSGANEEVAKIAFVLDGNRLALKEPLHNPHTLGEPVVYVAEERTAEFPIYNVEPSRGHLATLGAEILFGSILIQFDPRPDDSGINTTMSGMSTVFGMNGARITFWGVPAASSHDTQRCTLIGHECQASTAELKPFLSAPGQCDEALTTVVNLDSWQEPERTVSASTTAPPRTGCDQLPFGPILSVTPDTARPDTPAGYEVDLKLPRSGDPLGPEVPPISSLRLTLPPGVSLSPAGASGLGVCGHAEFDAKSCQPAASLGTVSITSPSLANPLPGNVYLGTPVNGAPKEIFLLASNEAITIHLAGELQLDPTTGQVTIDFPSVPQLPISEMKVKFPGGQTASLDNPTACGTAATTSRVVSSAGQVATPGASFQISGPAGACATPRTFAPRFGAGMTSRQAGAKGSFVFNVSREDGEGEISTLGVKMPAGLVGDFSDVPTCAEPAASKGDCPADTAIGSAQIVAGSGSQPVTLPGTVYLTGPYGGAPYGASIAVPAIAGPFNLGTFVSRGSVSVDPRTLRTSIVTDPLPRVFAGVPVRVRSIHVDLDRDGLISNPTSCAPASIDADIGSAEGASFASSSLFTVAGCAGLDFNPRLSAAVGSGASRSGAGLTMVIHAGAGAQANFSSLAIRLPRQLHPRLKAIRQACQADVYAADPRRCPSASVLSRMTISSPLLGSRLNGTGYLVARGGNALPVVVSSFKVGNATMKMEGRVQLDSQGIATLVFPEMPDVPIRTLKVSVPRNKNSELGATGELCAGPRPNIGFRAAAQNGARLTRTVAASVRGCGTTASARR
jgi:hypothetical protein